MTKARDIASATTPNANAALLATFPHRNLIINGAMQVAQRGTSQTGITSGGYKQAPDRFNFNVVTAGTWTASQSTTAPEGFSNSYKVECTVADASLGSADVIRIRQRFEGQNLQQLKKGTSNAESVTLSFYVRSSKTGTYIVEISDKDNNRHIAKSYSITTADTWQYVSVTYDGDTTGSLDNDNAESLIVQFYLVAGSNFQSGTLATVWASQTTANRAVGQVNLADTVGNDWYITGVQLEVGDTATPFEHRSYGDELARCQRYYTEIQKASGQVVSSSAIQLCGVFPTEMRATPSASLNGPITIWQLTIAGSKAQSSSNISVDGTVNSASVFNAQCGNFSGLTQHQGVAVAGGDQPLNFDAEL